MHLQSDNRENGRHPNFLNNGMLKKMGPETLAQKLTEKYPRIFASPSGAPDLRVYYVALYLKAQAALKERDGLAHDFTSEQIAAMAKDFEAHLAEEIDRCQQAYPYFGDWEFQYALSEAFIKSGLARVDGSAEKVKPHFERRLQARRRHKDDCPEDYATIAQLSGIEPSRGANGLINGKFKGMFMGTLKKKADAYKLSQQDLEDILQDTWLVLLERVEAKRFRIHEEWLLGLTCNLTTLLIAIGRNKIRERVRPENKPWADIDDLLRWLENDEAGWLDKLCQEIHICVLLDVLRELESKNPEHYQLVMLRYFKGLPHRAIAEATGRTENGVKVTIHRLLAQLKKRIEEECKKRGLDKKSPDEAISGFFDLDGPDADE